MADVAQSVANVSAGAQVSVDGTLAGASISGNALWVFVSAFNSTDAPVDITTVTATGASFTEIETLAMSASSRWQTSVFLAENITGQATPIITANVDASSFLQIAVVEVESVLAAAVLDADASVSAVGTDPTGAGASASATGLHIFGVVHNDPGAFTAGSGWTEVLNLDQDGSTRFGVFTRVAAASVSQTPAVTQAVSAQYAIIHSILKDVGGGGAPTMSFKHRIGVSRPAAFRPGHAR